MLKKSVAEITGTFALVFCGTGAMVIDAETRGGVSHAGIAIVFGLIVMSMIYALGDISGAHLNPAVSIAFVIAGRLPAKQLGVYIASQVAGALLASGMLKMLFPANTLLGSTLPAGAPMQSFVLELVLTFLLMLVIINVATGSKEQGLFAGLAIGSVVLLEAMFAGPICGASMNPARSIGPAVLSGHTEHLWIYIVAPVAGAALAIPLWKYLTSKNQAAYMEAKKKLLFVCIENSNRSQMSQAFAKIHGGDGVEAWSAGSKPSGIINPKAIAAMKELGYDLSAHHSKTLDEVKEYAPFDAVVTMGCGDACPWMPAKQFVDWQIPDPKHMNEEAFRGVRDMIENKVKELLRSL